MHTHLGVFTVGVHAIGRDKGILGSVVHIQESLMIGQAGTQDGGEHDVVLRQRHFYRSQRRSDDFLLVVERFRQLVSHHLAHPFNIAAKHHATSLIGFVAQQCHILIDDAVLF